MSMRKSRQVTKGRKKNKYSKEPKTVTQAEPGTYALIKCWVRIGQHDAGVPQVPSRHVVRTGQGFKETYNSFSMIDGDTEVLDFRSGDHAYDNEGSIDPVERSE